MEYLNWSGINLFSDIFKGYYGCNSLLKNIKI